MNDDNNKGPYSRQGAGGLGGPGIALERIADVLAASSGTIPEPWWLAERYARAT